MKRVCQLKVKFPIKSRGIELLLKVDSDEKFKNGIKIRNRYSIDLQNEYTQTASITCLNPSKATKTKSDYTINKIVNFFYENNKYGIGRLDIYNLYPFYLTDSTDLVHMFASLESDYYNEFIDDNYEEMKKHISRETQNIVAWGGYPNGFNQLTYDEDVKRMLKFLRTFGKVYSFKTNWGCFTQKGKHPYHPSSRFNNLVDIIEYNHKE